MSLSCLRTNVPHYTATHPAAGLQAVRPSRPPAEEATPGSVQADADPAE
ncbi:MAG: hypothetical protein NTW68_14945 [candidate division NC10 bacterium]|nr:hypothetical protein [candidate division NC10 bacterium]